MWLSLKRSLKTWLRVQQTRWLDKRIPAADHYHLDINSTFIFPSFFGIGTLLIALCLFILGTNYQNNLILILCYFLCALMLLSLFYSYHAFTQVQLKFTPMAGVFEGHTPWLNFSLSTTSPSPLTHLNMRQYTDTQWQCINIDTVQSLCKLALTKHPRGMHLCPRLSIESRYPFGLFRCWTHLQVPIELVVYPEPLPCKINVEALSDRSQSGKGQTSKVTSEDLQGLRPYRDTDPIHHVSWKHVAKGQGWLSKDFNESATPSGYLRYKQVYQGDQELALGKLCYQIISLHKQGLRFGLEIGAVNIAPNIGEQHQEECLLALASYQKPSLKRVYFD